MRIAYACSSTDFHLSACSGWCGEQLPLPLEETMDDHLELYAYRTDAGFWRWYIYDTDQGVLTKHKGAGRFVSGDEALGAAERFADLFFRSGAVEQTVEAGE